MYKRIPFGDSGIAETLVGIAISLAYQPIVRRAFRRAQNGWPLLRIDGSHHIDGKPNNPARISVPIHGNQSLKAGLLRHFLKVANLTDNDL